MFWKKEKSGAYIKLEEIYIFYSSFGSSGGSTERLPDKDDFKKEFTFKYLSEKQYSDSIQLKEEASEYIVAKVVKAFLCADSVKRQTDERLEMATVLNNNFGGTEMETTRRYPLLLHTNI